MAVKVFRIGFEGPFVIIAKERADLRQEPFEKLGG